jgi:alpha-D-ribose 1-methylphosphonate 5-triphosphate diphosphatase PhnM
MLAAGVVDTVSTDYAAGEWEPIIKGLALAVKAGAIDVARAVSLATGNVANLLPEVADGKGVIASGKPADLVLVEEEDIGVVRSVIVNGEFVVKNGQMEHGD